MGSWTYEKGEAVMSIYHERIELSLFANHQSFFWSFACAPYSFAAGIPVERAGCSFWITLFNAHACALARRCASTRTCTHAQTRALAHTYVHKIALARTYGHSHAGMYTDKRKQPHTHAHALSCMHAQVPTHAHTYTCTHTSTHTHLRAHTRAHTHTCLSLWLECVPKDSKL